MSCFRHGHVVGGKESPTYVAWKAMFQRCQNPTCKAWKWYGARGIKVCDYWRTFKNFLEDMGVKPTGLTLERIDNDGHYVPSNCKWATQKEQNLNRRIQTIGDNHGCHKLTEKQVLEIRSSNLASPILSQRFSVNPSTINNIKRRKIWKHLP